MMRSHLSAVSNPLDFFLGCSAAFSICVRLIKRNMGHSTALLAHKFLHFNFLISINTCLKWSTGHDEECCCDLMIIINDLPYIKDEITVMLDTFWVMRGKFKGHNA